MPDLNDRLRLDGARWRAAVDDRHALDPDPPFEDIVSAPVVVGSGGAWRSRLTGRTQMLLSVAALTVAGLAVVDGIVLASGSSRTHHTTPPLAATSNATTSASAPTSPSRPPTTRATVTTRSRRTVPPGNVGPATSAVHTGTHHAKRKHQAHPAGGTSSSTGSAAPACAGTDLAVSVSAPASSGDHATMTVTVVNSSAATCTISGAPAVDLTGDAGTVSATPATEDAPQLTLAAGAGASAEVDWDGTSDSAACTDYGSASVSVPGGASTQSALDPPAHVCDPATLVVHPLVAG